MTENQKLLQAEQAKVLSDARAAHQGLTEGQFVPFFQPLVTLRTGQLAGFEVLARWQHPTAGLIPPNLFIPKAEQDGWIGALTQQLLEKAFASAVSFADPLTLSINISPVQLHDLRLPDTIQRIALDTGFALSRLIIEITESALIDNIESAATIVMELKAMGCKLALDDFGTGYSSLHHLQSLPFDELKVDRSFVSSMTEKRESRKIVSAVIGLGQSLGLTTVAEGIETQEQAEMMLWLGCDLGQGYFYERPMPAENLVACISAHREKIVTKNLSAWKRISAANLDVSPSQRLAQLQALYDGAPIGLAFIDQNLRYVNLNKRLADLNGAPVETHLGNQVSEMIPDLFPYVEPYILRALAGEPVANVEANVPGTGQTRLVSFQPGLDEAGEVIGVAIAVADITERRRTEDALRTSEAHYRSMVQLNPQVLWIMDPQGRNLDVTPRWDKSTGLMKSQSTDHEWLRSVHPDDTRKTIQAIAQSRRTGSRIDVEYRVGDLERGWQWKRSVGSPRFNATGDIVCWYGSIQDIEGPTELPGLPPESTHNLSSDPAASNVGCTSIQSEVEESRKQALLKLGILDTPPEAEFDDLVALAAEICAAPISLISLVDSERQWFKASIGVDTCESPIGSSFCAHAIQQEGLFMIEDATKDTRFKKNPMVLESPHIRFYAGVPLHAGNGVAIGTLCVIDTKPRSLSPGQVKALAILSHQVQARLELRSERKQLLSALAENRELTAKLQGSNQLLKQTNAQLELLAATDSLTGILNRRAFEDRIDAEFSSALRKSRTLSLLVINIDDFKRRNDRFGHASGDEALRHVGEILRKASRAADSPARIGGEEFAVILPETTSEQATIIAKRIQNLLAIGTEDFPPVTISIGIASLDIATACWEVLLARADQALYEAKRAGKNRFILYEARDVA